MHRTNFRHVLAGAILALTTCLAARPAQAQIAYIVTDVTSDLAGVMGSDAFGISLDGAVTGFVTVADPNNAKATVNHAFLWTPTAANAATGTTKDLGPLKGGKNSFGRAIDNNVNKRGVYGYADLGNNTLSVASTQGQGFVAINGFFRNGASSTFGTNDSGFQVGQTLMNVPVGRRILPMNVTSFITGGKMDILYVPGQPTPTPLVGTAWAINSSNFVVGAALAPNGNMTAFTYDISNADRNKWTMGSMGVLDGGLTSFAQAVNKNNQAAGYGTVGKQNHAFYWNSALNLAGQVNKQMRDLGTLDQATNKAGESKGYGIDSNGNVVGYSTASVSGQTVLHAFLYQQNADLTKYGRLFDLNNLIVDTSWVLVYARAINDQGQIVGLGMHTVKGVTSMSAFLLTPTNP